MNDALTKSLAELQRQMDSGEMDSWFDQLAADGIARDNEVKHFAANGFNEKFELLKAHMQSSNTSSPYMSHDETVITEDEFYLILAVIRRSGIDMIEDTTAMFSTCGLVYNGVVFEEVSGQGTITRAFLADKGTTTYPLKPEFVICHDTYNIIGVYRFGKLIAKDVGDPVELLRLLGYSAEAEFIEDSDDLTDDLEGYNDSNS